MMHRLRNGKLDRPRARPNKRRAKISHRLRNVHNDTRRLTGSYYGRCALARRRTFLLSDSTLGYAYVQLIASLVVNLYPTFAPLCVAGGIRVTPPTQGQFAN